MSFTDRITLQDATPADQHFDKVSSATNSTVRRDASQPLDQPQALTISHEVTKDQKRVNSAVMLDRTVLDSGDSVTLGNARVLVKLSYDVEQITAADITEMVDEVKEFLSTANVTKLLNREH
jgi:hypothetical protein